MLLNDSRVTTTWYDTKQARDLGLSPPSSSQRTKGRSRATDISTSSVRAATSGRVEVSESEGSQAMGCLSPDGSLPNTPGHRQSRRASLSSQDIGKERNDSTERPESRVSTYSYSSRERSYSSQRERTTTRDRAPRSDYSSSTFNLRRSSRGDKDGDKSLSQSLERDTRKRRASSPTRSYTPLSKRHKDETITIDEWKGNIFDRLGPSSDQKGKERRVGTLSESPSPRSRSRRDYSQRSHEHSHSPRHLDQRHNTSPSSSQQIDRRSAKHDERKSEERASRRSSGYRERSREREQSRETNRERENQGRKEQERGGGRDRSEEEESYRKRRRERRESDQDTDSEGVGCGYWRDEGERVDGDDSGTETRNHDPKDMRHKLDKRRSEREDKEVCNISWDESEITDEVTIKTVQKKSEAVQKKSEAVQKKSGTVQKKSEAVQKKSEAVQKKSETVQKKSETVQKKSEAVQKKSETVQKKSEAVQKKSETVQKKSETVQKKSGTVQKESETVKKKSEKEESNGTDLSTEKDLATQEKNTSQRVKEDGEEKKEKETQMRKELVEKTKELETEPPLEGLEVIDAVEVKENPVRNPVEREKGRRRNHKGRERKESEKKKKRRKSSSDIKPEDVGSCKDVEVKAEREKTPPSCVVETENIVQEHTPPSELPHSLDYNDRDVTPPLEVLQSMQNSYQQSYYPAGPFHPVPCTTTPASLAAYHQLFSGQEQLQQLRHDGQSILPSTVVPFPVVQQPVSGTMTSPGGWPVHVASGVSAVQWQQLWLENLEKQRALNVVSTVGMGSLSTTTAVQATCAGMQSTGTNVEVTGTGIQTTGTGVQTIGITNDETMQASSEVSTETTETSGKDATTPEVQVEHNETETTHPVEKSSVTCSSEREEVSDAAAEHPGRVSITTLTTTLPGPPGKRRRMDAKCRAQYKEMMQEFRSHAAVLATSTKIMIRFFYKGMFTLP